MCAQFRFERVFNPAEGLATVIGRLNQRSANGKQETLKCAQFRFGRILAEGQATVTERLLASVAQREEANHQLT